MTFENIKCQTYTPVIVEVILVFIICKNYKTNINVKYRNYLPNYNFKSHQRNL